MSTPTRSQHAANAAQSQSPDWWTGLAGAWFPTLGEPPSNVLEDHSGSGGNGVISGPTWNASTGLTFNGTSDKVSIANAAALNAAVAGTSTIAVRARWTVATGGYRGLVEIAHASDKNQMGMLFLSASTGQVAYAVRDRGNGYLNMWYAAGSGLNDGNPHTIVGQCTAAPGVTPVYGSTAQIYVDGVAKTATLGSADAPTATSLGKRAAAYWSGSIEWWAVWSRVLTVAERTADPLEMFSLRVAYRKWFRAAIAARLGRVAG